MFFQTLANTVQAMATALYSSVDKSIQAMCVFTWAEILPYTVGIMVGLAVLKMLFEDDLVTGVRKLMRVFIPLLIITWMVKPGGADGCRIVTLKNDILTLRSHVTSLVAKDFSGGPEALITNTVARMDAVNAEFLSKALTAMSENQAPTE